MPETGDHKDPLDLHSKPAVLEAQRASDAAWSAVEDYRRQVDAQRRAGAEPAQRGDRQVLRAWTAEEDREFAVLLAAAAAAGGERARALAEAGLTSTYEVESEVRRHAREAAADTADA